MCSVNKYLPIAIVHHPEGSKTIKMSGGFPHSEIPGSKGALASPGLIAECHVLHRLLPPRHPPNALIALDPSRKTTGEPLGRGTRAFQDQLGSFHFPATIRQACGPTRMITVSILDLERSRS